MTIHLCLDQVLPRISLNRKDFAWCQVKPWAVCWNETQNGRYKKASLYIFKCCLRSIKWIFFNSKIGAKLFDVCEMISKYKEKNRFGLMIRSSSWRWSWAIMKRMNCAERNRLHFFFLNFFQFLQRFYAQFWSAIITYIAQARPMNKTFTSVVIYAKEPKLSWTTTKKKNLLR